MAGYIGSKAVNLSTTGADINGDANIDGDLSFRDNDKAIFGAGSDLQIYHDGSNSYIKDTATGNLNISGNDIQILNAASNEAMAYFAQDGDVTLYHNGVAKLATKSSGVDISGTLTSDGLTVNSGTNNTVAKFESSDAGAFIILEDSGSTNDGNRIAVEGDVMSFATGDSEAMRIDSNGRVMIGGTTVTDVNMLNIQGSGASNNIGVAFNDTNTSKIYGIQNGGSQLRFHDYSASATRMLIDSSGNVGIGTSSPTGPLSVQANSNATAIKLIGRSDDISELDFIENDNSTILTRLQSRPTYFGIQTIQSIPIIFNTNGSEAMRITSDGSVGINDSSPDGKLNVVSTAHNNGSIFDSTGTTQLWLRDTDASSNQKNWGFQVSSGSLNIVRANDDRASGFVTPIEIQQAPANSLVIDASGNVMVGTTDDQPPTNNNASGIALRADGKIAASRSNGISGDFNTGADGDILFLRKAGAVVGTIGSNSGYLYIGSPEGNDAYLLFGADIVSPATSAGANRDNVIDLGHSSARFDDIFATNGTIQTSDRNEKQDIAELSDAEQRVAVAAKGLLRKFRWRDAVEAKGDDARTHFGIIAQDLKQHLRQRVWTLVTTLCLSQVHGLTKKLAKKEHAWA